ncbi:MAG: SPOR domain-containing protein, partial [Sphingomonadales bacterium]
YDDPTAGAIGPSGSSRSSEKRYDEVGYAGIRGVAGDGESDGAVVGIHRSLPAGSYVEVTSLDTGRTILVLITGALEPGANWPLDLSAAAARQLGVENVPHLAVRVRRVTPTVADQAALNQGRPAAQRPDTPPVLLTALRKHLPKQGFVANGPAEPTYDRPVRPARTPAATRTPSAPPRAAPATGRYFVQVAALSNARNAQSLAQSMGGFVKPGGGLHRVQIGPFATQAQAEAGRRRAAGAGYKDARVFAN